MLFLCVKILGPAGFFAFLTLSTLLLAMKLRPNQKGFLSRNLLLSIATFLLVTYLYFSVVYNVLTKQIEQRNPLLQAFSFLFDSVWLQFTWSATLSILLSLIVFAAILLPYGYLASRSMYGDYAEYKGHEREAIHSALSIVLGINKGTWLVKNGTAEVLNQPAGALARFGGPGTLIVQEGHAVVLERSGRLSRVVGCGLKWLQPFERVSMVIPLWTRTEHIVAPQVATKDKVLLEKFEFWAFHKPDPGPEGEQIANGQYAYNEKIILERIWSTSGKDWREAIKQVGETAIREVAGRYSLSQIVPLVDPTRTEFKEALVAQMNRVTQNLMGVKVVAVDIGEIKAPADAEKRLLDRWLADWDNKIAKLQKQTTITKGEATAAALNAQETARARAQMQMINTITQALEEMRKRGTPTDVQSMLALRLIEALEKRAAAERTSFDFLYDGILQQLLEQSGIAGWPGVRGKKSSSSTGGVPPSETDSTSTTPPPAADSGPPS